MSNMLVVYEVAVRFVRKKYVVWFGSVRFDKSQVRSTTKPKTRHTNNTVVQTSSVHNVQYVRAFSACCMAKHYFEKQFISESRDTVLIVYSCVTRAAI
jgi:F0F1-type ATP synthase alpha subunit